jgi:hypothetical protein
MNSYNNKNSKEFIKLHNQLAELNFSKKIYGDYELFHDNGIVRNHVTLCDYFFNRYIISRKYYNPSKRYDEIKDTHFGSLLNETKLEDEDLKNLKTYLEFFETFLLILFTLTQKDLKNTASDNFYIKEFNSRIANRSYHNGLYYDKFKKLCRELCVCTAKAVSTIKKYYTNTGYVIKPNINYQELNIYFRKFSMIFSSCKFYNNISYNFDNNLVFIIESLVHINHFENLIRKDSKTINVIAAAPSVVNVETPTKEEGEITSDDDIVDILEHTIKLTNRKRKISETIESTTAKKLQPDNKKSNTTAVRNLKLDGKKKKKKSTKKTKKKSTKKKLNLK